MAKPSWVTLNKSSGTGGGSVKVTASTNTTAASRSGSLTIKTASGLTKSVSVYQQKEHYSLDVSGRLFIRNTDPNNLSLTVDVSVGFYNIDGDTTGPYACGTAYNISTGTTAVADLEWFETFKYQSDQEPFDRFGWIQLKVNGNMNLKGYLGGDITVETSAETDYIPTDKEFDIGRIELSYKIPIDLDSTATKVYLVNELNSPIVITEFY